jgi:hypothetical protein
MLQGLFMFEGLFQFGSDRSVRQALGFFLLIAIVLGGLAVARVGTADAGSSQQPLVLTRPTEGTAMLSDGRVTIVSIADGTRTVTLKNSRGADTVVEIAADGSTVVAHPGGTSVVTTADGATSIDVNGVSILAAADGSTSVRSR